MAEEMFCGWKNGYPTRAS